MDDQKTPEPFRVFRNPGDTTLRVQLGKDAPYEADEVIITAVPIRVSVAGTPASGNTHQPYGLQITGTGVVRRYNGTIAIYRNAEFGRSDRAQ